MTASSFKSGGNFPHYSRLNGAKMWKTILTDRSPWLQVKLNNVTKIEQIASQICLENLYAKTFTMSFSMDGITWSPYREDFTQRVMFVLNLVQDGRQIQNGRSKRHCGGRGGGKMLNPERWSRFRVRIRVRIKYSYSMTSDSNLWTIATALVEAGLKLSIFFVGSRFSLTYVHTLIP